ncbi:uncharacterized protein LAJ45_01167 [Morchella importuna]|uniref:uncharacterized protein n=1 Tax=Morchella importuna TaxID=1174673 RepID=UPI001E8D6581|nr:uncharacterized protein LAJ45_01167 [Morchella importuna]KAH8154639.1 hypothetical protein LAJ45_01167 [Morchella importuna]
MASPNPQRSTTTTPAATAKTLQRRPARRDMSNPDPTIRRVPIPSMLRSVTIQPRPRPTPPPPSPVPGSPRGPYTPFANRGPYVVGDPGPYWLRLDDLEVEPESSPTKLERRKTFADRGPYVIESKVKADVIPDRSPTVSPVSMLELPRFDIDSRVSLAEASEVSVRSIKSSIHEIDSRTIHLPGSPPNTTNAQTARSNHYNHPTLEHDEGRFEDPIEDDGRFDDPMIPMRNVLTRSGTIRQEPVPDPIRRAPNMPRSQSLYMFPTVSPLPAAYSLTYEERFDIFTGFDGVGRARTPFEDESDEGSSVVAEASLTRESTPVCPPVGGKRESRVERMPSNPDFGPVRMVSREREVGEGTSEIGGEETEVPVALVEERLRKPKLKHRIKHLSAKITMAVDRMRRSE